MFLGVKTAQIHMVNVFPLLVTVANLPLPLGAFLVPLLGLFIIFRLTLKDGLGAGSAALTLVVSSTRVNRVENTKSAARDVAILDNSELYV